MVWYEEGMANHRKAAEDPQFAQEVQQLPPFPVKKKPWASILRREKKHERRRFKHH